MKTSTKFLLYAAPALIGVTVAGLAFAEARASLKDAFKDDFLIGAALNPSQFTGKDEKAVALIKQQFNSITPENVLKWEVVHPTLDKFNFGPADQYVDFGEKNGMFIIGHCLIWHSQTPGWVFKDDKGNPLTREALLDRMKNHISTVVGRYKGRIKGWDVVNEAINDDGSMRQSQWMKIIGPDFIEKAFEFAHAADPDAQLYYNDYSLENAPKRKGALALIKGLKDAGIPVYAVGLQGHDHMDWPTVEQQDETISDFAKLGMKVCITEFDIDVLPRAIGNTADVGERVASNPKLNPYPDGLPADKQEELAKRYADLFRVFVKHKDVVTRVTFWGVTDRSSWLNGWPIRGRTSYPLLFDRDYQPKPAFEAVIKTAK